MNNNRTVAIAWLLAIVALRASVVWGEPSEELLAKAGAWQTPSAERIRTDVFAWLDQQHPEAAVRQRAESLWTSAPQSPTALEVLTRVVNTLALADAKARQLVERCSGPRPVGPLAPLPWLAETAGPQIHWANLRLWYGRWLVQESMLDEAEEQLGSLRAEDVVDPATLLFYQAAVHHRLLHKSLGLKAIKRLLEQETACPRRYVTVARLMEADLGELKEDSLGHIARRMNDVERRLDLGHAGPKVRKVEDGVIESLDKLIKKLEDQQKNKGGGGGSTGNNLRSSSPAKDSTPMGGKGPGDVVKRNVGNQSGWGNLPPKQREEALQQVGREFPSHYRDVIEQYFRKLANEGNQHEK